MIRLGFLLVSVPVPFPGPCPGSAPGHVPGGDPGFGPSPGPELQKNRNLETLFSKNATRRPPSPPIMAQQKLNQCNSVPRRIV